MSVEPINPVGAIRSNGMAVHKLNRLCRGVIEEAARLARHQLGGQTPHPMSSLSVSIQALLAIGGKVDDADDLHTVGGAAGTAIGSWLANVPEPARQIVRDMVVDSMDRSIPGGVGAVQAMRDEGAGHA